MRQLFIIIFFLIGITIFAQNRIPTKNKLNSVLKKSIQRDHDGRISIGDNPWEISNEDSAYYIADTLVLYNNDFKHKIIRNFCKIIEWTFFEKDYLVETKSEVCDEPPMRFVPTKDDWYKWSIESRKMGLYLVIKNCNNKTIDFKILDLQRIKISRDTDDDVLILRLLRIRRR